jgi:Cu-processing system permease protein
MMKVVKYVVYDVLRSKMVIAYALLLLLLCGAIYSFSDDTAQAVVSLLHLVLFVVPLISIVFGTIHYYNSREFIELLLAQPIRRNAIFLGEYGGLSVSLAGALLLGLGIPVFRYWSGIPVCRPCCCSWSPSSRRSSSPAWPSSPRSVRATRPAASASH